MLKFKTINYFLLILFSLNVYSDEPNYHQIHIVNHGWHTGIIVPSHQIKALMPELQKRFNDKKYIEFGWGDKGFYQAKEITIGITLKAIFTPSESVMHVVGFSKQPSDYFKSSEMKTLCLKNDSFIKLNHFIRQSFYRDDSKNLIVQRKGIYGDSQFYTGVGDYHLGNTCNKWTAEALNQSAININPSFKLTAQSVMFALSDVDNQTCN